MAETISSFFGDEERAILAKHNATPEQYFLWASRQFKKQYSWSLIVITLILSAIFLAMSFSYFETKAAAGWGLVSVALLIAMIGLTVGLSAQKKKISLEENVFAQGLRRDLPPANRMFVINLAHRASARQMRKLNEETWQNIRSLDQSLLRFVPSVKTDKKVLEKLEKIKNKFRRITLFVSPILLLFGFACIFIYLRYRCISPSMKFLLISIPCVAYGALNTGCWGWFFTASLIGFHKRDINVWGKRGRTIRYTGLAARIWAVLGMIFALLLWLASLLPFGVVLFPDL